MSVVRFRPRPPRFTLQRSQPMRLAFLFPGTNSPRVRSISGLLLALERFPHFSLCPCTLWCCGVRQPMFRTDTTGTPTLIKPVCCAGVPAVSEEIISTPHYRAEWSGITRSVNGSRTARAKAAVQLCNANACVAPFSGSDTATTSRASESFQINCYT